MERANLQHRDVCLWGPYSTTTLSTTRMSGICWSVQSELLPAAANILCHTCSGPYSEFAEMSYNNGGCLHGCSMHLKRASPSCLLHHRMSGMNQVLATCWTCLLLSAFLCEPVLSKGGRGGSRGSSRGSPSRSSTAGNYRGAGTYGGTRSRFRAAGRSSPVRVAAAAAAGAAVALTADKWYASAYRRSNADNSEEELDYYNRTNYFDALMSGSPQRGFSLPQMVSIIVATFSPKYGLLLDSIL